ncbi:MAG: hypothetical protein HQL73_02885 [Magnetococcales bacterium]|nr:hypothetical protein [Magnetococcales bacterium]
MAIENNNNSFVSRPVRSGGIGNRGELFSHYTQDRLKAEFLMQQVNTRYIDMNSKLASELERLLERISGLERRKTVV